MTDQETAVILAQLYTIWPQQGTEEQAQAELRLWQWAFATDDYDIVQNGINMWAKGGKPFMPKPSDIRRMIAERTLAIDPDTEWGKIRKSLRRQGRHREPYPVIDDNGEIAYRQPETFHPLVEQVIANIGWRELALLSIDDARKAFTYSLNNLLKLARDNMVYGNQPLSLPDATTESLPDGLPDR